MVVDLSHVRRRPCATPSPPPPPGRVHPLVCRAVTDHPRNVPDDVLAASRQRRRLHGDLRAQFVSTAAGTGTRPCRTTWPPPGSTRATWRPGGRSWTWRGPPPRAPRSPTSSRTSSTPARWRASTHIGIGGDFDGTPDSRRAGGRRALPGALRRPARPRLERGGLRAARGRQRPACPARGRGLTRPVETDVSRGSITGNVLLAVGFPERPRTGRSDETRPTLVAWPHPGTPPCARSRCKSTGRRCCRPAPPSSPRPTASMSSWPNGSSAARSACAAATRIAGGRRRIRELTNALVRGCGVQWRAARGRLRARRHGPDVRVHRRGDRRLVPFGLVIRRWLALVPAVTLCAACSSTVGGAPSPDRRSAAPARPRALNIEGVEPAAR